MALVGLVPLLACSKATPNGTASAETNGTENVQGQEAWGVFEGQLQWSGRTFMARLRPLLPSADRRAFDANAWKLQPGQVAWSLRLDLGAGPSEEEPQTLVSLSLAKLALSHADGPPLHFREVREVTPGSGVYDPLQILLAAPEGRLASGGSRTMVLIGPSDLKAPSLQGLPFELKLLPDDTLTARKPTNIPLLDLTAQAPQ